MSRVLVVAPHPDDETLGCGGTIKKLINAGHDVYWLIITGMTEENGYKDIQIKKRALEIEKVAKHYGFTETFCLNFPPAGLNDSIVGNIIDKISEIVNKIKPDEVYIPYPNDVHTDHRYVFEAMKAISKWFRYSSVKRILCYETLSETNFGLNVCNRGTFIATVYENITDSFSDKLKAMELYRGETGEHPFPRSSKAIEALAILRGSECGCYYAEAFMLLKEIHNG